MKRYLSAVAALVGTAALVASSVLVTATAAHADPTGTLVVNVVDQYGRPTVGVFNVLGSDGTTYDTEGTADSSSPGSASTLTYTLPVGGYAIMTVTPWSGLSCAGVSPCTIGMTSTSDPTPVTTVNDGQTTTYTMHVVVPSITGSSRDGSALTLHIPDGLTTMQSLLVMYDGFGYGSGTIGTQWLRSGADIAGASGASYTTVAGDGSRSLSARLTMPAGLSAYFGMMRLPVSPFTTNAIKISKAVKVKTKTTLKLARSVRVGERASAKVKVKARHHRVPTGNVVLTIGKFKTRKPLKHGSAFITLPSLRAGGYKVTAKYVGAPGFAKSTKKATLSVRR